MTPETQPEGLTPETIAELRLKVATHVRNATHEMRASDPLPSSERQRHRKEIGEEKADLIIAEVTALLAKPERGPAEGTESPPLSRLDPDDGQPMWRQIIALFHRHGAPPPTVPLRDQLVNILAWARYGEAAALSPRPSPIEVGEKPPESYVEYQQRRRTAYRVYTAISRPGDQT